jgi:hypothetical protein
MSSCRLGKAEDKELENRLREQSVSSAHIEGLQFTPNKKVRRKKKSRVIP